MRFEWDKIYIGLLPGLIIPIITFVGYYHYFFGYMPFEKFMDVIFANSSSPIISLCLISDLPLFFIFMNKNYYRAAKGVVLSAFIYGSVIIYLKYIA